MFCNYGNSKLHWEHQKYRLSLKKKKNITYSVVWSSNIYTHARAVATRFLAVRLDNGRWYLQLTIYAHVPVACELNNISRRGWAYVAQYTSSSVHCCYIESGSGRWPGNFIPAYINASDNHIPYWLWYSKRTLREQAAHVFVWGPLTHALLQTQQ